MSEVNPLLSCLVLATGPNLCCLGHKVLKSNLLHYSFTQRFDQVEGWGIPRKWKKKDEQQQFPLDLHARKTGLRNNRTGKLLYSSCVWTAELWVILHVQAPKPKGDKYKAFVVSSFEAVLSFVFFFLSYNVSLSEVISAPLSRSSSLCSISLFCLSLREHSYHCAPGPAGNPDCGGGNGCLRLQTQAEVSKKKKKRPKYRGCR